MLGTIETWKLGNDSRLSKAIEEMLFYLKRSPIYHLLPSINSLSKFQCFLTWENALWLIVASPDAKVQLPFTLFLHFYLNNPAIFAETNIDQVTPNKAIQYNDSFFPFSFNYFVLIYNKYRYTSVFQSEWG